MSAPQGCVSPPWTSTRPSSTWAWPTTAAWRSRRNDGVVVTYEVTEVADYPKGDFPTPQVFGATAQDSLRLITCTGPWDSLAQSYEDNRVVYASTTGQQAPTAAG